MMYSVFYQGSVSYRQKISADSDIIHVFIHFLLNLQQLHVFRLNGVFINADNTVVFCDSLEGLQYLFNLIREA